MPESEEDLRRYLREKVAEEKEADELARWRGGPFGGVYKLTAPDPLFGDATFGETDPAAEASGDDAPPSIPPPAPPAAEPPASPASPAPSPPPVAAVPAAAPDAAPASQTGPLILRAFAVFGLVIAVGAIVLMAQRSTSNPMAWLAVGLGLAVCAALLFLAGRSGDRRDPGNPPIVR